LIPLRSLSLFPVFVFLFLSRGKGFFFRDFAGVGRGSFIWTNQLACCYIIASILPLSRIYPRCNKDANTRSYMIYHTLNSILIYKVNETNSAPQLVPVSSTTFLKPQEEAVEHIFKSSTHQTIFKIIKS
jgi:hypothetical protein